MKKKLLSALLSVAMVATLLVGCGAKTEEAPAAKEEATTETPAEETADASKKYDGVTINFWSMWNSAEPQGQVIQAAADAFEAETGAKVNIEWKGRDIQQLIMAALEQGEKIDLFEDDYARIAKTYVEYCYDLTDMAAAANYADQSFACFNDVATAWAGFLPCVTEQPQVGGVIGGIVVPGRDLGNILGDIGGVLHQVAVILRLLLDDLSQGEIVDLDGHGGGA